MRKSFIVVMLVCTIVVVKLAYYTKPSHPEFPHATIAPSKLNFSPDSIGKHYYRQLSEAFAVEEIDNPFPDLGKPVLSIKANNTVVAVFAYPNASSATSAMNNAIKKLKLTREKGMIYEGPDGEYLVFVQFIDMGYSLFVAKGPRWELEAIEFYTAIVGPSPWKILHFFTPLGSEWSERKLEEKSWLAEKGLKLLGYMDSLEGAYKNVSVALFVYRPREAQEVYSKLVKAFKESGWKVEDITLPSDFGRNPAGHLVNFTLLSWGNKMVYIELAGFPSGYRIAILYGDDDKWFDVAKELW
ncbi:hypothetical protein P8X24_08115 [Pyrococcus kukulkanii]|uniref:hypothetical protein n=1 Tax=Pyrococcus kukulkanii TaxID=1609559 RepID=UPI0035615820